MGIYCKCVCYTPKVRFTKITEIIIEKIRTNLLKITNLHVVTLTAFPLPNAQIVSVKRNVRISSEIVSTIFPHLNY